MEGKKEQGKGKQNQQTGAFGRIGDSYWNYSLQLGNIIREHNCTRQSICQGDSPEWKWEV